MKCKLHMSICSKGSVPLLERWRILERVAYLLRGGTLLLHDCFTSGELWSVGRGGSPFPHTWQFFFLHLVRPPSWEPSPICYIIKHSPICLVSWSLGTIVGCNIVIVILFLILE
jgi:hypothetical protein